jgi:hypothetical protein
VCRDPLVDGLVLYLGVGSTLVLFSRKQHAVRRRVQRRLAVKRWKLGDAGTRSAAQPLSGPRSQITGAEGELARET